MVHLTASDLVNGLTPEQVLLNREKYGKNELPEVEMKSILELVMDGFEDKTLIMLSVSAIVSLVLGIRENPSTGWIEGTAILMAVLVVVFVTAANDYEKVRERTFLALLSACIAPGGKGGLILTLVAKTLTFKNVSLDSF